MPTLIKRLDNRPIFVLSSWYFNTERTEDPIELSFIENLVGQTVTALFTTTKSNEITTGVLTKYSTMFTVNDYECHTILL